MYRLLIGPLIIGILAFLIFYLVAPFIISESDLVAVVAKSALGLSNAFFETMPPSIASYINNLNLAIAGLTVALVLTVLIQLLVLVGGLFVFIAKWIVAFLQRDRKAEKPEDLPPIDMDSRFESSEDGSKVLGRGLDSIDQD